MDTWAGDATYPIEAFKECPYCHEIRMVDNYCSNCGKRIAANKSKFKVGQYVKFISGFGKITSTYYNQDSNLYSYQIEVDGCKLTEPESQLKPYTNRDWLNSLDNEKLAELWYDEPHCRKASCNRKCEVCLIEWLEAPYEGE